MWIWTTAGATGYVSRVVHADSQAGLLVPAISLTIGLTVALATAAVLTSAPAFAQEAEHREVGEEGRREGAHEGPKYVVGVGGAIGLALGERHWNPGGAAFFELEAVPHWLSLEAGVSVVKVAGGAELTCDILFKKPFELRKGIELLVGLGPEVVQTIGTVPSTSSFGIAGVIDLMFWPTERFGVFIAPGYDLVFKDKASLTFGATAGPMVSWR